MSPESFAEVESAFHRIQALAHDDRRDALDELRDTRPNLAEDVGRLLAASEQTWQLGEWGPDDDKRGDGRHAVRGAPPMPERIGSFRVLRELGRGGMGVVYLGERDDEFHQRVALKVVERGVDAERLGRLRRERQILATLDHPNIARLVDGGSMDDGRPFFAMDYIEGRHLLDWCDQEALSVEARLRIFLDVCSAVQYLHRNLVIHRDIKPSNILVTADGTPKLLDFGIAKLLEPESGHETRTGLAPMTPDYASPEQLLGEPLTTATDVFSLGVVLFQLLTGVRPYAADRQGPASLTRFLLSADLPRASSRVTAQGESKTGGPPLRPRQLAKVLRGDLDNILAVSLRREPERRYPSVAELADDLQRYLELRPVRAHPESFGYRLGRFVRRQKLLVAAGVLIFASLAAGIAGISWQAREAERARTVAEDQAVLASTVSSYLVEIFGEPDPGKHLGNEPKASDLLARGHERLEDLADEPAVQAKLALVIGQAYQQLGHHEEARTLYRRCLELRRSLVEPPNSDLVEALLYLADAESILDDTVSAEAHLRIALDQQRTLVRDLAREATLLNDLGVNHFRRGESKEAMRYLSEALRLRRETLGPRHEDTAQTLANIASLQVSEGAPADALEPMQEALDIYEDQLGSEHPSSLEARSNLAVALFYVGRHSEAIASFEQLIQIQKRVYGTDHPSLASNLNSLGWMILRAEETDRSSLAVFDEAVGMLATTVGTEDEEYVRALVGRGQSYKREDQPDEAAQDYRNALGTIKGDPSMLPLRLAALSGLGSSLASGGLLDEAVSALCEAIELRIPTGRSETAADRADRDLLAKIRGQAQGADDAVPAPCRLRVE